VVSSVRSRRPEGSLHGLLAINKPMGMTSHDVVNTVRRTVGRRRIGHCGSLDPLATGVLVVCIGRATRLARFVMAMQKTYVGTMRLGVETDTQDRCGRVVRRRAVGAGIESGLHDIIPSFLGEIEQVPPMYSAVKHAGVPLYKLAREGRNVIRNPRRVHVYRLDCGTVVRNRVDFRVVCSSGTYVRTLCHDIGNRLGCGATMSALERVAVGRFTVDETVSIDRLSSRDDVLGHLRSPEQAVSGLPAVKVEQADATSVVNGRPAGVEVLNESWHEGEWVRIENCNGKLLAVGKLSGNGGRAVNMEVRPKVVLEEPACTS